MPRSKRNGDIIAARHLRKTMSLPEVLLWEQLRRKAGGIKVRRQHAFGPYVLDFYVAKQKLAIEIDGSAHDMGDRPMRDEARDSYLAKQGIETVRVLASEVLASPEGVSEMIVRLCSSK